MVNDVYFLMVGAAWWLRMVMVASGPSPGILIGLSFFLSPCMITVMNAILRQWFIIKIVSSKGCSAPSKYWSKQKDWNRADVDRSGIPPIIFNKTATNVDEIVAAPPKYYKSLHAFTDKHILHIQFSLVPSY